MGGTHDGDAGRETGARTGDREAPSLGDVFPFDRPYDAQADAIERLAALVRERGIAVFEGPCGTGKTLSALTPAVQAVRDHRTPYERVLCITKVKQQLPAFEQDIASINDNLPADREPVRAISLVGKADLCPYADQDVLESDEFYAECDDLRDPVRQAGASAPGPQEKIGMWESMVNQARDLSRPLAGDDWEAPYQAEVPEQADGEGDPYCPFYANSRADGAKNPDDSFSPSGVLTPQEMMARGAEAGMCPHAMMRDGLENAEVLIGNYSHVFDPVTVERMTGELIGPETILVVDEAHGVEQEVRELLSDSISRYKLKRAIGEINQIVGPDATGEFARIAEDELSDRGYSGRDAAALRSFLQEVLGWVDSRAIDELEAEDDAWLDNLRSLPEEFEVNLREPDSPAVDEFTEWVGDEHDADIWRNVDEIGQTVAEALSEAAEEIGSSRNQTYVDDVGRVLGRWRDCNHEEYFRQFTLSKRDRFWQRQDGWKQAYRAKLEMRNCIPSEDIASRLDRFGAAVLMSATLAPLDVYREVVGVDELADQGREVEELIYELGFPEENRQSLAVTSTPFTGTNRDDPEYERYWDDDTRALRREYADIIEDVATTTPGNVMVAMPTYDEATWAGERLRESDAVSKKVIIDEGGSSEAETERRKEQFFAGDGKILCTGVRGKLTEGVDYDGDRLAAIVVCGVPIRSLGGDYPTAIQTAYEARFGDDNGFEYAFSVPATRKARQAIGRVIRGDDEVGVRVLADDRYADGSRWNSVRGYLPEYARDDFTSAEATFLEGALDHFWKEVESDEPSDEGVSEDNDTMEESEVEDREGGQSDETARRDPAAEARAVAGDEPPTR